MGCNLQGHYLLEIFFRQAPASSLRPDASQAFAIDSITSFRRKWPGGGSARRRARTSPVRVYFRCDPVFTRLQVVSSTGVGGMTVTLPWQTTVA